MSEMGHKPQYYDRAEGFRFSPESRNADGYAHLRG